MPIQYDIDSPRALVTIVWEGEVPITEWAKLMDQVQADPRFRRGFHFLSDRRSVTVPPTADEIRISVDYFQRHRNTLGRTVWAILVAPDLADFGMMRMGQTMADDLIVMSYHREPAAGEAWLLEQAAAEIRNRE